MGNSATAAVKNRWDWPCSARLWIGGPWIRQVAAVPRASPRQSDLVARLGGDAVVAFLVQATAGDACTAVAALESAAAHSQPGESHPWQPQFSSGVVSCDPARHRSIADRPEEGHVLMKGATRARKAGR